LACPALNGRKRDFCYLSRSPALDQIIERKENFRFDQQAECKQPSKDNNRSKKTQTAQTTKKADLSPQSPELCPEPARTVCVD